MHRWAVTCAKVLPFPLLLPLLPLPIAIGFLGNQDSISQSINQLVSTLKTHLSMRETHHVGSVKLLAWLLQFCSAIASTTVSTASESLSVALSVSLGSALRASLWLPYS